MEEKKQELLKLIENLDINKLQDNCDDNEWSPRLNNYGNIICILKRHQKEKSIEQKLKELGFKTLPHITRVLSEDLYMLHEPDRVILGYSKITNCSIGYSGAFIVTGLNDKEILNFANYLLNIKNGAINDN